MNLDFSLQRHPDPLAPVNRPVLSITLRSVVLCAALSLAACRGDDAAADPPASAALPPHRPVAAPAEPLARAADPAPAPSPTAQDSAAATAEDVSPEWKQRARSMGSYARCLEQVAQAPPEGRARLEEACSRHPDAPH
jgi:hypothetical protein